MRKQLTFILVLLAVSFVLVFSGCGGKKTEVGIDDAVELLKKMSQTPLGLTYKADPANIKIDATAKGSIITLSEPEITFDTAIYEKMGMPGLVKTEIIPIKAKQLVLLYDPAKRYLGFLSIKEFAFDMIYPREKENEIIRMSAQEMSFEGYNISPLLNDKAEDAVEILVELLEKNMSSRGSLHGLKYEVTSPVLSKEMTFSVDIEEVGWQQAGDMTPFAALFQKEGELSFDFAEILSGGSPILDVDGHLKGLRFSVKQDGKELGEGKVTQTKFHYFLKPDEKKEFFTYGMSWGLGSMEIAASGKEKDLIERIGNIKSLNMDFAFEHMTPEFVQAYFNLVREGMAVISSGVEQKMGQAGMNRITKMVEEMGKSQPIIRFSIAQFKHYFGSMEAEANFQFQGMGVVVGKAILRIHNMDEVLKKMKDELPLPEMTMAWMQSMFIKDNKGDGVLTFEIKSDPAPGLYLNGQPIKQ